MSLLISSLFCQFFLPFAKLVLVKTIDAFWSSSFCSERIVQLVILLFIFSFTADLFNFFETTVVNKLKRCRSDGNLRMGDERWMKLFYLLLTPNSIVITILYYRFIFLLLSITAFLKNKCLVTLGISFLCALFTA